jgi:hypothetical protein
MLPVIHKSIALPAAMKLSWDWAVEAVGNMGTERYRKLSFLQQDFFVLLGWHSPNLLPCKVNIRRPSIIQGLVGSLVIVIVHELAYA